MKQGDKFHRRLFHPGYLLNRETGELVAIDDDLRRLKRMRKRVSAFGRNIAEPFIRDGRGVMLMVTLTYRPGEVPMPGDRKEFMRKVRRKLGEKLLAYTNVAETQKRGMTHYHYLLVIRRGAWLPSPDKNQLWTHGSTNVKRNVQSAGYLLKYVSKCDGGEWDLPRGMRAYDVRVRLPDFFSSSALTALRLTTIPYWLAEIVTEWCLETDRIPERIPGGGWRLSGEDYFSPWEFKSLAAR